MEKVHNLKLDVAKYLIENNIDIMSSVQSSIKTYLKWKNLDSEQSINLKINEITIKCQITINEV